MKERQRNKWTILKRMLVVFLAITMTATGMPQITVWAKTAETAETPQTAIETKALAKAAAVSKAASISNPRREEEFSMSARQKTTWDCIYFGHYPQSEITVARDPSLYYRLEQEYWGKGYVILDGVQYWKISGKFYGGDPIKWRVLNISGNTALLLSDVILDCQQYYPSNTAITWEKSTIRSWLNGYDATSNSARKNYSNSASNFIDVAFTGAEQAAIRNTVVKNENSILGGGTNGGNDTIDKLFLLSESETGVTDAAAGYGFVKNQSTYDEARRCQVSAYAAARGLETSTSSDYKGNARWWLRSPGAAGWSAGYRINSACDVDYDGSVSYDINVNKSYGVRVALNLDLSSTNLYSYAGTVSSAGDNKSIPSENIQMSLNIPKDATAEQIVQKMNLSQLINNVSFPSEKIEGPSVTIAGKTFSLFSLDASMNLKLGQNVQAKVDTNKKAVQVLVGFDKFDGSAQIEAGENSSAYWSESYRQVKELYTGVTGNKVDSTALWNKFSKLRGKLKKVDGSIGISANASVAGYMEFSYASGDLKFAEGGVILEAALGTEQTYHLPPCPAVYVTFGLEVDFNGTVKLVRNGVMNYSPSMNAQIGLDANIGAGVGSNKLKTYAEIGMSGKLNLGVKLPAASLSESLSAGLTADVYMESKVFGFNGPSYGPQRFANVTLYPKKAKALSIDALGADAEFDWEEAKPMERDYLSAPKAAKSKAITEHCSFTKENLYPYNAPQLAVFRNGQKLLVWIDDSGEKSGVNKTSLMYSLYDGGNWSAPQSIAETGGANDYPAVYSDGERAYVVWQKARQMPEDASLTEVLSGVELYLTVWENGAFSEAVKLTEDNEVYEMLQCVTAQEGKIAAAWVENSENDPFQSSGRNLIRVTEYTDGNWQEQMMISDLDSAANLNLAYIGGRLTLVYESGDAEHSVVYLVQGSRKKQFEGSSAQLENGVLYFYSEDGLTAYDVAAGFRETLFSGKTGDFTVADNGRDKAVVTTVYDGFQSELRAYLFDRDTGTWSEGITLTDEGDYIRDYSLCMDADGSLSAAVNFVEISEGDSGIYGAADLCVMEFGESRDLKIGGISYEEALAAPGGLLPLAFTVTNNGMETVREFSAEILDEEGRVLQSGRVSCEIAPGESAETGYNYRMPETLSKHKIKVKVYAEDETRLSDNTAETEIGYADISVTGMYLSGSGSQVSLKGQIQNTGYEAAKQTVVTVYDSNGEGTVIGTIELGTVGARESREFELTIPEAYMRVHAEISGNVLYVAAESLAEELNYANNAGQYLIQSYADEPLMLNHSNLSMNVGDTETLEITCFRQTDLQSQTVSWSSSDDAVVTVENGEIRAAAPGSAVVTAQVGDQEASCTVKVLAGAPVAGVCMEETSIRISMGESRQLAVSVLPANAADKNVTWETSDKEVAVVSADGTVQGISAGTAFITVRSTDGNKSALCQVTVLSGENQKYTASFTGGENTSGKRPESVTKEAGTLITMPQNTYQKEGLFFVGWSDGENSYREGESYRMPYRDVEFIAVWKEEAIPEYVIRASADAGGSITPEGEISVQQGGEQTFFIQPEEGYTIGDVWVDGKSVGSVREYTFDNVSESHTLEASFNRLPGKKVQSITLSETEQTLKVGETLLLTAAVMPQDAEEKTIVWKAQQEETASVKNGTVTALSVGTTVITAESTDGSGVSASCTIHVIEETENQPNVTPVSPTPQHPENKPDTENEPEDFGNAPKVGDQVTDSNTSAVYRITSLSPAEAEYVMSTKKGTSIKVPNSAVLKGTSFSVTSVAKSAFAGNKKLKSVIIGKNVKAIGEKAFYGCKALKKITIKSTVLKKAGKNALKGIHKNAKIKVPKKKLKAYRKLLKKKGQGKKVKIQ